MITLLEDSQLSTELMALMQGVVFYTHRKKEKGKTNSKHITREPETSSLSITRQNVFHTVSKKIKSLEHL